MKRFSQLRHSGLAKDTAHLSLGQGTRLLIQAAYFLLLARALGPDSYGAFVSVVAIASVLGPFSGLGAANLFIKNVRSGSRQPAVCWGNGLMMVVSTGALLAVLASASALLFRIKIDLIILLTVCVADLICMRVTDLASFGFGAVGCMKDTAVLTVVISLFRLLGIVVLCLIAPKVTLRQWVWVYLLSSVLGAVYALARGYQLWGRPKVQFGLVRGDIAQGIFFSISTSATGIYNDVDKLMLGQLSGFASTGIYSAAYRIIDVSMTPVRSLGSAAYPEFFQIGMKGIRATYSYAQRLIFRAVLYGIFISASLWITAPLLPHVLGSRYSATVFALRWLALIPLLRCCHTFLADAITGAGFQKIRTAIQVFVGIVNVGLNLAILPLHSWRGAAWTSLACDGMLAALFWLAARHLMGREKFRPLAKLELAGIK